MSNPNKYSDDIKRIAKDDDLKGALLSQADKEFIEGALNPFVFNLNVGTSSDNGTGDGTGGTTTTNGEETQDNTNETDPNDPNTFNKGGGGGSGDAPESGTQDVESVMDGEAGPQAKDGSDGTLTSSPTGSLTGLTGATDCSTSQCVNLHLDGQFPAPDGWDDADTPPDVDGWVEGVYWHISSGDSFHGTDPTIDLPQTVITSVGARALVDQTVATQIAWLEINASPSAPFSSLVGSDTSLIYSVKVVNKHNVQVSIFTASIRYCSGGEPSAYCPTEAPTLTEWPTDGCYDLALIDGTFQANQYDSEAPANAGGSQVDVCFGTDRFATVYVTANGGSMIVETATAGGTPTGSTYVYAADGTLQYAGDSATTNFDQYLPK